MKVRLAARVFIRGVLHSEERLEIDEDELTPQVDALVEKHLATVCVNGDVLPHMIELELLDEPNLPDRFLRIGTDPSMMNIPMEIKDGRPN